MPAKRKTTKKTEPPVVKYRVPGYLTHVAHGGVTYPVIRGSVALPPGEDWYKPLIEAGELIPMEK